MKRANLRAARIVLGLVVLLVVAPARGAEEKAPAKKRPHTDSQTPFVHRIQLRDEQDNPISVPKTGTEAERAAKIKLAAIATTCGKCHDYPAISVGWHFNAGDAKVGAGRAGEPWILTDDAVADDPKTGAPGAATRSQIPLSYRGWAGTWKPGEVGMSDWKFAQAFGRHLPGGGIFETARDQRFGVSGTLQNDCLVCHIADNNYDGNARYEQIFKKQNFKYAPLVAAGVGTAEKPGREKMKDTWTPPDPSDPNADGPKEPPFEYDMNRFNAQGHVLFNISKRTPNERCYFCHTSLDTGRPQSNDLAQRWRHDRDVHLVKGMLCVDCHRHGLDHNVARGYEKEGEKRNDPTIATLSCQGCHYGNGNGAASEANLGGRNAAPRPLHKGLPTLHFDKLSCTTCHSGPYPSEQATSVLTSMAHRLGIESFNRVDDAAPVIQEPVFLRDPGTGKITPHKAIYPTFWGRQHGEKITPMAPELLNTSAALKKILGPKPANDLQPSKPLSEEEIVKALDAIAAMEAPAAAAKPATTAPTTAPWYSGEPVFVTGGQAYKRGGNGKLATFDHESAAAYTWALGHDVRGAQQALGARGCMDCHASGTPIFDSTLASHALYAGAAPSAPTMAELRGEPTAALSVFASTYRFRPILIATGYTCSVILAVLLIAYAGRAIGSMGRRRGS